MESARDHADKSKRVTKSVQDLPAPRDTWRAGLQGMQGGGEDVVSVHAQPAQDSKLKFTAFKIN